MDYLTAFALAAMPLGFATGEARATLWDASMCNLYSMTTNQKAIKDLFKVDQDFTCNLPAFPAIFPDSEAPVVRNGPSGRELVRTRWGMPSPPQFAGPPITNIRNTGSSHWQRWLKPESRCLVPFTSFSEYDDTANPKSLKKADGSPHPMAGKKDVVWFAQSSPIFHGSRRHDAL